MGEGQFARQPLPQEIRKTDSLRPCLPLQSCLRVVVQSHRNNAHFAKPPVNAETIDTASLGVLRIQKAYTKRKRRGACRVPREGHLEECGGV